MATATADRDGPPSLGVDARPRNRRSTLALLAAVTALWALLATRRCLSGDEAYYLWGARARVPWPIADHPPLLGVLLRLADRLRWLPIELRVRCVSIALQLATVAGLARAAAATAPFPDRDRAALFALLLGSVGIMPFAGALLTTPDAPMLCALAWLFALTARSDRGGRPPESPAAPRSWARVVAIGALAALAVLAKVAALPALLAMIGVRLAERRRGVAIALASGVLVALPWAVDSLRLQRLHVLGRGPLASAPELGALASVATFVGGQVLLWSPALVWIAVVELRRRGRADPALSVVAGTVLLAALASALIARRPPEPNWGAPAGLVAIVAAARALADDRRRAWRRWTVGVAATPALIASALWASPLERGPLARLPVPSARTIEGPVYARAAWSCVYRDECKLAQTPGVMHLR